MTISSLDARRLRLCELGGEKEDPRLRGGEKKEKKKKSTLDLSCVRITSRPQIGKGGRGGKGG